MTNITPIKKTKYMNKTMEHEFHELLTSMMAEAIDQLKTKSTEEIESQNMPDDLDVATMRESAAMIMRRRERDALMINKINKSLTKIKNKDYGYCDDCGGEIGEERLRARPTADLCITCKEAAEKAENQYSKRRAA